MHILYGVPIRTTLEVQYGRKQQRPRRQGPFQAPRLGRQLPGWLGQRACPPRRADAASEPEELAAALVAARRGRGSHGDDAERCIGASAPITA